MYFSPSTGGFYDREINLSIPSDAVEISVAEHDVLLAGQSSGKRIVAGSDGQPMLQDRPPPTADQIAAAVIADRDARLRACDWTQLPDVPSSIKTEWSAYRQDLWNVKTQPGFPSSVTWPVAPGA